MFVVRRKAPSYFKNKIIMNDFIKQHTDASFCIYSFIKGRIKGSFACDSEGMKRKAFTLLIFVNLQIPCLNKKHLG